MSDDRSDDGMINQTKTQDSCYGCTLRETSAKLLSRRESWSSWLVLIRLMSARRLPATLSRDFIAKKCWEIMHRGCMTSFVLPFSTDLDCLAETQLNQQSGHVIQLLKVKQDENNNSLLDWDEGPLCLMWYHPLDSC